jgi:hypothetical protein
MHVVEIGTEQLATYVAGWQCQASFKLQILDILSGKTRMRRWPEDVSGDSMCGEHIQNRRKSQRFA